MKLKLVRKIYTETSTISDLYIDGKRFSYTLEDKVRSFKEAKVWGKTAIPAGTYTVVVSYSNRFKQLMPLLTSVPGFEGVRIHWGSIPENTDGCVLVGYHNPQPNFINGSQDAYKALFPILTKAAKTEKITMEIIDSPH